MCYELLGNGCRLYCYVYCLVVTQVICPRCDGKGRIVLTDCDKFKIEGVPIIVPCPECNQQGVAYCCEGITPDENHYHLNKK